MKKSTVVVIAMMLILAAGSAFAAANSQTGSVQIQASKAESLSISGSALAVYNLAALAPQTLTITTNWNLLPSRASVGVCVYMDSTNGVMKGSNVSNTDVIDQTMVQTKVGAGSWANIDAGAAACGVASGVTTVNSYTLATHADRTNVTKTDTVSVQLNGVPATIEADTYTGTLTLVAYAQ